MTVEKLIKFLGDAPANAKIKVCSPDEYIETESEDVTEAFLLQSANSEETSVILIG